MTNEENHIGLSPTVLQVIERFAAALRADEGLDSNASDRLEKLLRLGGVPKPDEINAALFGPDPDSDT